MYLQAGLVTRHNPRVEMPESYCDVAGHVYLAAILDVECNCEGLHVCGDSLFVCPLSAASALIFLSIYTENGMSLCL